MNSAQSTSPLAVKTDERLLEAFRVSISITSCFEFTAKRMLDFLHDYEARMKCLQTTDLSKRVCILKIRLLCKISSLQEPGFRSTGSCKLGCAY